ncbi:MAG: IS701 family transposase, partial [Anaerolineae bacterium]|nr:IS701 family transposase [Anaerolineae bacterium]
KNSLNTPVDVVPLTVSEVRRLLNRLVWRISHSVEQLLAWSFWRRQHQARAKAAHYRRHLARSPA